MSRFRLLRKGFYSLVYAYAHILYAVGWYGMLLAAEKLFKLETERG